VSKQIPKEVMQHIEKLQRVEISEHHLYKKLATIVKDPKNRKILNHISKDELGHYEFWKKYTKKEFTPSKRIIWKYLLLTKLFGVVFAVRLMGQREGCASIEYDKLKEFVPTVERVINDEIRHEKELVNMIKEDKLNYIGSIVLGLNDALVELTGALAGLTFAFLNTRLIAIAGLITGIAASLSMAASEYLSIKAEKNARSPYRAAGYTGVAYLGAVLLLIFPYFVVESVYMALGWTVLNAILIILVFTYYSAVTHEENWGKKFLEMFVISLGVAVISFLVGFLIRIFVGMDI
jgi:vacuolar iron transporter family protein